MAHEVGHVTNFHIVKRKKEAKTLQTINKVSNLSLIAGSLISNNSDYLMQSIITNQVGIKNYFQLFSRDQEREADYYAINTLNKLNLSTQPLIKFLNLLERKAKKIGINEEYYKFSTHPIYKERYTIINSNKIENTKSFDIEINKNFNFIRAKLFGFTEKNNSNLSKYLENEYLVYSESIILSKEGKLKESMIKLNNLIKLYKKNNFLIETKADILFSNGYLNEANLFYQKVIESKPKNHYANKRIFEIQFSLNTEKNELNKLFHEYSFLLKIFIQDKNLMNKFRLIAENSMKINWIEYFKIEKKLNKKINKNDIETSIQKLIKIKNDTSDIILIDLINILIQRIKSNA